MSSKKKEKRKLYLVIVEGPSDETALTSLFARCIHDGEVNYQIAYGDITSCYDTGSENVCTRASKLVKKYLNTYKLKPDDLEKVILLSDTDGAYCCDDAIIDSSDSGKFTYSETGILGPKEGVRERNRIKSRNMDIISGKGYLKVQKKDIPLECYYLSSSLDHVLFNRLNLTNDEKEELSYDFALCNDYEFLFQAPVFVRGTLNETWDFIRCGNNSLKRFSNLPNLLLAMRHASDTPNSE